MHADINFAYTKANMIVSPCNITQILVGFISHMIPKSVWWMVEQGFLHQVLWSFTSMGDGVLCVT